MASMTCENCKVSIGPLEAVFVWKEHCVCSSCYTRLMGVSDSLAQRPEVADSEMIIEEAELIEPGYQAPQPVLIQQLYQPAAYQQNNQDIPGLSAQQAPYFQPQSTHVHTQVIIQQPPAAPRNGRGLVIAGVVIMAGSIALLGCAPPVGVLTLVVGSILLIVGLCI